MLGDLGTLLPSSHLWFLVFSFHTTHSTVTIFMYAMLWWLVDSCTLFIWFSSNECVCDCAKHKAISGLISDSVMCAFACIDQLVDNVCHTSSYNPPHVCHHASVLIAVSFRTTLQNVSSLSKHSLYAPHFTATILIFHLYRMWSPVNFWIIIVYSHKF